MEAPANIACDAEAGQEFVCRQPRTARELAEVCRAADVECFDGHACDGNAHWTPDLVRTWYVFFLLASRAPTVADELPTLETSC